jgi:hypothetical protein
VIDAFAAKLEELVERSKGKIRADVAHRKIVAMGLPGRSAPPAGRSPRSRRRGGRVEGGCTGRGSRSRGCGRSRTSGMGPGWPARRRSCSVSGWPGVAAAGASTGIIDLGLVIGMIGVSVCVER